MNMAPALRDVRAQERRSKIEVRGVTRVFSGTKGHEVTALRGTDIVIPEGQFCCVVGPSGCGKTTLLRIVAGLMTPSEGQVLIRHDDLERPSRAVVFQDYSVFPWKTVLQNVELPLRVARVPSAQARATARSWLKRVGLSEFEKAWPATLSGGMKQRVAIARAFACEPEILLMDEPLAALDAQLRQLLQEELLGIWESEGTTVLFVTHSIEEALLLGDRILVMSARPGRVLEDIAVPFARPRDPAAVRQEEQFSELREKIWSLLRTQVTHQIEGDVGGGEDR